VKNFSHWTYIFETNYQPFIKILLDSDYLHKIYVLMKETCKDFILCSKPLFEGEIQKMETILIAGYNSASLIFELSDKETIEKKMMLNSKIAATHGNLLNLACELIDTGRISILFFKKIAGFLYTACKITPKIPSFISKNYSKLLLKLFNALHENQLKIDSELQIIITGLIYLINSENGICADSNILSEVQKNILFTICEIDPEEHILQNIRKIKEELQKTESQPEELKNVENIHKIFDNDLKNWLIMLNANNIGLEILAEMLATDEPESEINSNYEEMLEDEKIVEKMDIENSEDEKIIENDFINEKLIKMVIKKTNNFITPDIEIQLKSLKEAEGIIKSLEKMRMNAYAVLLNLVINKSKKFITCFAKISEFTQFLYISYENFCMLKNSLQNSILSERIIIFIKISLEKYGQILNLQTYFKPVDIMKISEMLTSEICENILLNLISICGILQKYIPHGLEQNKICCEKLLGISTKPNLNICTAVLNALFDIYAEENFNSILKELNVLKILEDNLISYKSLVF